MKKFRMSVTLIIICIFLLTNSISSFADKTFNDCSNNNNTNNEIINDYEQKKDSASQNEYDPLIDNKEETELKIIYKNIQNDYKNWDVSWNDFLSDYIKTGAYNSSLYYKSIKSALDSNADNLRSQSESEPPAWYYNTGYSLPQSADYSSLRSVSWAVWNEIMSGTLPSQLSPKMTCTRAQAATFMYRFVVNYLFLY